MNPRALSWIRLALLLMAMVQPGCSKCGRSAEAPAAAKGLWELVPKSARAVVVVPDVTRLGVKLKRLERLKIANFASQLQGAGSASEYLTDLFGQIGVDFRDEAAMRAAGLAPERGLAVVSLGEGKTYSVVAVSNFETFTDGVGKLAASRLGATQRSHRAENGQSLWTFDRPGGHEPALGLISVGAYVLLAPQGSVESLQAASVLTPDASLAHDAAWSAAVARLPSARDVIGRLPPGSIAGKPQATAVVSVDIEEASLTLDADISPLPKEELAGVEKRLPGPDLLNLLPADAVVTGRFSGDPSKALTAVKNAVGRKLLDVLAQAGLSVKEEFLDNLQPGAVFAISLAPSASLGNGVPILDVRRTNPFSFIQLVAVGASRDAAKASATLSKLVAVGPKVGLTVTPVTLEGKSGYQTKYAQGEGASFVQWDDKILVAAPMARLTETLKRAAAGGTGQGDASVKAVLDARPAVVVMDLAKLADQIRALPSQSWGIGGFAIKATVLRWLEATDDLRSVSVGVSSSGEALQAQLAFSLRAP